MNIRINAHGFRFRVSPEEAQELLEKGVLGETFPARVLVPPRFGIRCVGDERNMVLNTEADCLWLSVPRTMLETLVQGSPSKDGIKAEWQDGNSLPIRLSLEIDIKRSKPKV